MEITEKSFLENVSEHGVTILKDEGLYRHVRFKKPGTTNMSFDIITWPGYLCYTGDMGTYVFTRLEDMFTFFRSSHPCQPGEDKQLRINPSYWAEKLEAVDRVDGLKKYSPGKFREYFKEWMDEHEASPELREEIENSILSAADDGPHEAYNAAIEFESEGKRPFQDFFEVSIEEWTYRYLWCCYALAWGIQKYDEVKGANAKCRERQAIKDLTEKVRFYHDKYGSEYIGGRPFQLILKDLKELGIDV